MKRVEWYIAKVCKDHISKNPIDLWEQFPSKQEAKEYVRKDGANTPFVVVKLTYETVSNSSRR